jgi:hypothetical protein
VLARDCGTVRLLPLLLLLCLVACTDEPTPGSPAHTVRDSAGIEIVESARPAWQPEEAWTVDPEPETSIGTVDGDPAKQFNRVTGMAPLANGGLVVGQLGPPPIVRWFDSDGEIVHAAGGEGEGPGEFAHVLKVEAAAGDTILVWDPRLRRISAFSPEGEFLASRQWDPEALIFPGVLRLGKDGFAVYRRVIDGGEPVPGRTYKESLEIVVDPDATRPGERTVIGPFAHAEYRAFTVETASGSTVAMRPAYLGATASVAVGDSSIYVGEGVDWEYHRFGYDGRLERIVRRAGSARPVTPEVVDVALEASLADVPDEAARLRERRRWEEASLPDSLPITTDAHLDPAGNLWVRHYSLRFATQGPSRWSVFSPNGVWLGTVDTPDRLWVRGFLDDAVYGVYFDELGVEHVRLHRIRKPAAEREGG